MELIRGWREREQERKGILVGIRREKEKGVKEKGRKGDVSHSYIAFGSF